jgi:hypothetical protein
MVPAPRRDLNNHSPRHIASTHTSEMAAPITRGWRRTGTPAAEPASAALSTPNVIGR